MPVDVTLETVAPSPTAVVAATTTTAEFPSLWAPMLDKVWTFLRKAPPGVHKNGHNVMLYRGDDTTLEVEVGVQVSGPFEPDGDVRPSALPGGLVAKATHTGPMARIGDTYVALQAWCEAQGHRLAGPRWEIYGDPDRATGAFSVEVFWSLREPSGAP